MTSGMRAAVGLVAACVLCLALAACGGSGSSQASNRQQVTHMFVAMQSAMAKGDYAGACQWLSQRQQSTIVAGAKKAGLKKVSDCAGAFQSLITTAGVSKAELAQAFGGQAPKISSLSVHGNQATVTYTATDNGKKFTETDGLVKENGSWKADRTISRHNDS